MNEHYVHYSPINSIKIESTTLELKEIKIVLPNIRSGF